MFSCFKKKEKNETIFPTAKEMTKKTAEKWPTITDEQILKGIKEASSMGNREITFHNAKISSRTYKKLRKQGYQIEEFFLFSNRPCFTISW